MVSLRILENALVSPCNMRVGPSVVVPAWAAKAGCGLVNAVLSCAFMARCATCCVQDAFSCEELKQFLTEDANTPPKDLSLTAIAATLPPPSGRVDVLSAPPAPSTPVVRSPVASTVLPTSGTPVLGLPPAATPRMCCM